MLLRALKIMLAGLALGLLAHASAEELFPQVENRVTYQKVVLAEGFDVETVKQHFKNVLGQRSITYRTMDENTKLTGADLFGALALKSLPDGTVDLIRDFNNSNPVIVKNDSIQTKVLLVYVSKNLTQPQSILLRSTLKIDVKPGRYRYTNTDFEYEHRIRQNPYFQGASVIHKKNPHCSAQGTLASLSLCDKPRKNMKRALETIAANLESLHISLEGPIKMYSKEADDW